MNEIALSDERLISTARAAELTGYARDYLGQLCRNGTLKCRMIGKQWFVDVESLKAYAPQMKKPKKSDFYISSEQKTEAIPQVEDVRSGTFVFGDDEYIPTQKAARLFGYSQDYVGQLARSGEVPAKKIGRRWFIAKNALRRHRDEKDRLLQAVQAESVSMRQHRSTSAASDPLERIPFSIRYYREDGTPLLPKTRPGEIHHHLPQAPSHRFAELLARSAAPSKESEEKQENTQLGLPRTVAMPSVQPSVANFDKSYASPSASPLQSVAHFTTESQREASALQKHPFKKHPGGWMLLFSVLLFVISASLFAMTAFWFAVTEGYLPQWKTHTIFHTIDTFIPADRIYFHSR